MQRDGDVGNSVTAPSTTPFRQYDARLGRWWSVDPLSAMTGKTYQALGGNPISMVDPWGVVDKPRGHVFFVGGLELGMNDFGVGRHEPIYKITYHHYQNPPRSSVSQVPHASLYEMSDKQWQRMKVSLRMAYHATDVNDYWDDFDDQMIKALGLEVDNASYLYASTDPWSVPWQRRRLGELMAYSWIADYNNGRISFDKYSSWVIVVDHSQGDAAAQGLIDVLTMFGFHVHTVYSFAPKQAQDVHTNPAVRRSVRIWSPEDWIAPQGPKPQNGSTAFENVRVPRLPDRFYIAPLTYYEVNKPEGWKYGGHSISSYKWYFGLRKDEGGIEPVSSLPPIQEARSPITTQTEYTKQRPFQQVNESSD